MWAYAAPIGSTLALLIVGFIVLRLRLSFLQKKLKFADLYRERFIAYCNSYGRDHEAYTWLILKSNRMQNEMGEYGVFSVFSPPGGHIRYKNYPIITNMIPELRSFIDQNERSFGAIFAPTIDSYANIIDEALLRYIGVLGDRELDSIQTLRNPLLWLRTGVEQILSAPFIILAWVGLIGSSAIWRLQGSYLFKMIAGITTIIGLVSALITIILGWDQTVDLTRSIFENF